MFRSMQKKLDRGNLVMQEGRRIRVIRAFNRDEYEKKRFEEANWIYADRYPCFALCL